MKDKLKGIVEAIEVMLEIDQKLTLGECRSYLFHGLGAVKERLEVIIDDETKAQVTAINPSGFTKTVSRTFS